MERKSDIKDMDVARVFERMAAEAALRRFNAEGSDRYWRRRQKRRVALRVVVVAVVLAALACLLQTNMRDNATVGISDKEAEQIDRNILGIK